MVFRVAFLANLIKVREGAITNQVLITNITYYYAIYCSIYIISNTVLKICYIQPYIYFFLLSYQCYGNDTTSLNVQGHSKCKTHRYCIYKHGGYSIRSQQRVHKKRLKIRGSRLHINQSFPETKITRKPVLKTADFEQ